MDAGRTPVAALDDSDSSDPAPAARNVVPIRRARPQVFTDEEIRRRIDEAERTGHPSATEIEIAHMQRLEGGYRSGLDELHARQVQLLAVR